jgi:hypothetical protein
MYVSMGVRPAWPQLSRGVAAPSLARAQGPILHCRACLFAVIKSLLPDGDAAPWPRTNPPRRRSTRAAAAAAQAPGPAAAGAAAPRPERQPRLRRLVPEPEPVDPVLPPNVASPADVGASSGRGRAAAPEGASTGALGAYEPVGAVAAAAGDSTAAAGVVVAAAAGAAVAWSPAVTLAAEAGWTLDSEGASGWPAGSLGALPAAGETSTTGAATAAADPPPGGFLGTRGAALRRLRQRQGTLLKRAAAPPARAAGGLPPVRRGRRLDTFTGRGDLAEDLRLLLGSADEAPALLHAGRDSSGSGSSPRGPTPARPTPRDSPGKLAATPARQERERPQAEPRPAAPLRVFTYCVSQTALRRALWEAGLPPGSVEFSATVVGADVVLRMQPAPGERQYAFDEVKGCGEGGRGGIKVEPAGTLAWVRRSTRRFCS